MISNHANLHNLFVRVDLINAQPYYWVRAIRSHIVKGKIICFISFVWFNKKLLISIYGIIYILICRPYNKYYHRQDASLEECEQDGELGRAWPFFRTL